MKTIAQLLIDNAAAIAALKKEQVKTIVAFGLTTTEPKK